MQGVELRFWSTKNTICMSELSRVKGFELVMLSMPIDLYDNAFLPKSFEIGFLPFIQVLSASTPPIWHVSLLAKTRSRYQPFTANSKISYKVGYWHGSPSLRRETAVGRLSFLADFGLT